MSSATVILRLRANKIRANCSIGRRLAKLGLAVPRPKEKLIDPDWTDAAFLLALERYGYGIADGRAAVVAFQRRFRPENIDGVIDGECRAILLALLLGKRRRQLL